MRRDETDRIAARASYEQLSPREKAAHIWLYYKWYILLGITALLILGSVVNRILHKKEAALCLAMTNVTLNDTLMEQVTTDWLTDCGLDPDKSEVVLYSNLYLANDAVGEAHKAAYATQIKLMAAVEEKKLDAVLMSRQALDILSGRGYLLEVSALLAGEPELLQEVEPLLTENVVVLDDNAIEYQLGEAEAYEEVTVTAVNAVRLDELPLFADSGFQEPLYLGFVAPTPRQDACVAYLRYLTGAAGEN